MLGLPLFSFDVDADQTEKGLWGAYASVIEIRTTTFFLLLRLDKSLSRLSRLQLKLFVRINLGNHQLHHASKTATGGTMMASASLGSNLTRPPAYMRPSSIVTCSLR